MKRLTILIGKTVYFFAKLRGGGSALPGLIVEKLDPDFISRVLGQLPYGVVVISGTNGKTTTTKIVTELLESAGVSVFTNRTGSNFSRGIAASLLKEVSLSGKIKSEIAILELDEAWGVKFVEKVKPSYCLLLNVMRDQLDRFGEIDTTTKMLRKIALATTKTVILNRNDNHIAPIAKDLAVDCQFFGVHPELISQLASQDQLDGVSASQTSEPMVRLEKISSETASYKINGETYSTSVVLHGIYNLQNAAAGLGLTRKILDDHQIDFSNQALVSALGQIKPAFGRGEEISINGATTRLVLVKNPGGFQLALASDQSQNSSVMIAMNDNYADGRDVSWYWDVDFSKLRSVQVISGSRAFDIAIRLDHDDVSMNHIEPSLPLALKHFLSTSREGPKIIYCSYTAMQTIRKELAKLTKVEVVR